ncbi:hypothetical protein INS49_012192 [Diaporthe citri]|uniref:uncharacterized protein n=1 Tax=Diaporthe citri TaxID=83186 RepID=UPI001C81B6C8|nr:uncharacterized protein INS49_012192 [Diaporthe citri]KAG6358674.1 hypothetical protein INS49_012192 [Diaporthe citri]
MGPEAERPGGGFFEKKRSNIDVEDQGNVSDDSSLEKEQNEVVDATKFSSLRKLHIVVAGFTCTFNGNLGSSMPSGALDAISAHFGVTNRIHLILLNSLFMVGYVIGPLAFAPLSEYIGRRPVLIGTFLGYLVFMLACSGAPNYPALLVFRLLCGINAAAPTSVLGGLYADTFDDASVRGNAMALYMTVTTIGPLIGPIISGFSSQMSWRWPFWIAGMIAALGLPVVLTLPETYAPVLHNKAVMKRLKKPGADVESGQQLELKPFDVQKIFLRPVTLLVTEPIVFCTSAYLALAYAVFYLMFQAYPVIFQGFYGLSPAIAGLAFIPQAVGVILALIMFAAFTWYHDRQTKAGVAWTKNQIYRRLPLACIASPCLFSMVISLFWLGWTVWPSVSPIVPMLSGIFFGCGFQLLFMGMINYLTDVFRQYSASAHAAASMTRSIGAITLPLAANSINSSKSKSADWDDTQRWIVKLSRNLGPNHEDLSGDFVVRAQFLMPAGGLFYSPSAPDAPGLEVFMKNHEIFHTACWNYAYTGGSQSEPDMVNLQDKRVGIIGTGATVVQAVPELAKWAKQLYVFQRTPSYCSPREQLEKTPESWAKVAGGPGWQSERMRNLNKFLNDHPEVAAEDDLLKDGWSRARQFSGLIGSPRAKDITPAKAPQHLQRVLELDAGITNDLRKHVEHEVEDPEVAEMLKAWYPGLCKRPTFHQEHLKTFNRPNVTLVETDGQGISGYTDGGILVANGEFTKEYEVDVLVLATGFATTTGADGDPSQVLGMPIRGRDGRDLTDKWKGEDFAIFFGVATHEFPNLLFYKAKGATGSANTTYPLSIAAKTAAHIAKTAVKQASNASGVEVEVSKEAEQRYTESLKPYSPWYATVASCTPTYFTDYRDPAKQDKPDDKKRSTVGWTLGSVAFEDAINKWIDGNLEGFVVRG